LEIKIKDFFLFLLNLRGWIIKVCKIEFIFFHFLLFRGCVIHSSHCGEVTFTNEIHEVNLLGLLIRSKVQVVRFSFLGSLSIFIKLFECISIAIFFFFVSIFVFKLITVHVMLDLSRRLLGLGLSFVDDSRFGATRL